MCLETDLSQKHLGIHQLATEQPIVDSTSGVRQARSAERGRSPVRTGARGGGCSHLHSGQPHPARPPRGDTGAARLGAGDQGWGGEGGFLGGGAV